MLIQLALLAGASLLGLYGLFALLYRGEDGSGNTYVEFGGREIDAQWVGLLALMLALALVAILVFLRFPKRSRSHFRDRARLS